ncbi:hypothetical protein HYH02_008489 [Chlamydomonas schloesseri]|uniref:Uncharacterized protein n=1 Tax=Chlamydomonas schloesseri TaxID=2026947 RepID=A0A836B3P5_9CHLO|nr:hypothetical protein HYH02_008489 [Chlamydomonas schloesseri]|eukprot:KAG2446498.1 hypothetical protein HYH02_008489 [Chlamydomonas schloesseri]
MAALVQQAREQLGQALGVACGGRGGDGSVASLRHRGFMAAALNAEHVAGRLGGALEGAGVNNNRTRVEVLLRNASFMRLGLATCELRLRACSAYAAACRCGLVWAVGV